MIEEQTWIKLVELAQRGRENCMSLLAQEAMGRLRAYVYRVTLDHDLTEDLSQEALLQMVKSLDRLNKAESFWPWMYRIAQSKIQQHYKTEQKMTSVSDSAGYRDFLSHRNDHHREGMGQLAHKELSKKVMAAMKQIKQQYRAVLSLRCFEQLSYSDVAVAMQCSEVRARVLFFRAKQALKKQLTHQGLSKSLLLMCLGLFGRLTAPAEATSSTVTVTAASTKVGLTAAIIATAGTRLGIVTVAAAAIGLAGLGGMSVMSEKTSSASSLTSRNEVRSFHYTTQLRDNSPSAGGSLSKGAYEQWFYFPEGIDGPMFMRMQRWDPQKKNKLCAWLQNDQGNFYYDSGKNQVHINNYRVCWSNLKVQRLPIDTAEFTDFLSHVEGEAKGFSKHARDPDTGLLKSSVDYRFVNAPDFQTNYKYNTIGPEYFQYDRPADVPILDERDQMHARGWTYFLVNGQINGQTVSGRGQIPFVYNARAEHPAWMTLNIGDKLEITDCKVGAQLCFAEGIVLESYPRGTFFQGLARPWMGMHTVDIIRRDAAAQQVPFMTRPAKNKQDAVVVLHYEDKSPNVDLVYTIDLETDIVKGIRFDIDGRAKGSLVFSYLQDIQQVDDEFIEPTLPAHAPVPTQKKPGMLWLVYLAQGILVR